MAAVGYDPLKAAEFTAHLLGLAGGSMDKLKLSKLLYLAERECVALYGHPMFYDAWYSVKDGPICNNALNGIDGEQDTEVWSRFTSLDGNTVSLVPHPDDDDRFQRISLNDEDIAVALLKRYGWMRPGRVRAEAHKLPEYRDPSTFPQPEDPSKPRRKRWPITDADMATGIGLPDPERHALDIAAIRRMHADDPFAD